MHVLSVIGLATALSVDSLVVGFAYGARGIKVPAIALVITGFTSWLMLLGAMLGGFYLGTFMRPAWSKWTGAAIMIVLGVWRLRKTPPARGDQKPLPNRWDSTVTVIRHPENADLDRSGSISLWEAVLLGISLAMDATAAGLGAGLAGLPFWLLPTLTGTFGALFFKAGMAAGQRPARLPGAVMRWLPGTLLIVVGLVRLR